LKNKANRGSTLVMVLIAVLILSLIALSALTQSNTEMGTTRNFFMDKSAFYSADAGLQVGINEIRDAVAEAFDPSNVSFTQTFGKYTFY
jgi:Tfp pilus assembly protein PilX